MQTITVRASSWGALFDCAFKWEGVHLLKMRSPSSPGRCSVPRSTQAPQHSTRHG
ncbi:hypothetical protein P4129_07095 [Pseudomonas aeruginosa]|nr:hypothetical protein [Pseudomonas aeruginosa]MDF5946751.1 hypothetical protein [Pseudomonas aeruginosa]